MKLSDDLKTKLSWLGIVYRQNQNAWQFKQHGDDLIVTVDEVMLTKLSLDGAIQFITEQLEFKSTPTILGDVMREMRRAKAKHPGKYPSRHHAIAVIEEEFIEARAEVFTDGPNAKLRAELIQLAASAITAIQDLDL